MSGAAQRARRRLVVPAVLLLVLAVLTVWRETSRPGAAFQSAGETVRLYAESFELDDLTRLEVQPPGDAAPFTLSRDARGLWQVDRPFAAPAAPGRVRALAEHVLAAAAEARSDDTTALADFLLGDGQSVRVRLFASGDAPVANLAVGASSGPQGAFVRRLDGAESRILSTSRDLRGALGLPVARGGAEPVAPDPTTFHDLAFPGRPLPDARRLHLRVPGRELTVERPGRVWELAPGAAPAALRTEGVRRVVHQLEGALELQQLVDPVRTRELGFETTGYVTELLRADGSRLRLEGVHRFDEETGDHEYYARLPALRDPAVVWRLSPAAFRSAFPDGDQLVSLATLRPPILRGDVLGLAVTHGDPERSWTAERAAPRTPWRVLDPESPLATDTAAVDRAVGHLADLTPIDWLTAEPIGPSSPLVVTMGRESDEEPRRRMANVGLAPDFRGIAFETDWSPVPLVFRSNELVRVLPRAFELRRSRVMERWIPEDLREITLRQTDAEPVVLTLVQGDWRAADQDVHDQRLIAWLRRLLAVEVVAPDAEPTESLGAVGFWRKDGARLAVSFGRDAEGRPTLSLDGHHFLTDRAGTVLTLDQLAGDDR